MLTGVNAYTVHWTCHRALQATPLLPELLQKALDLVQRCPCPYVKGCPCCVQHLDCKNYNAVLHKAGAVLVLQEALQQEAAHAHALQAVAPSG